MLGTYWSVVRADGSLYGECPNQGIVMTDDGQPGTWTGAGVGVHREGVGHELQRRASPSGSSGAPGQKSFPGTQTSIANVDFLL